MRFMLLLPLAFTCISAFSIEAGGAHTCAYGLFGDELKCWGLNNYGQLGYEDTNNRGVEANQMGANLLSIDLGSNFVPSQIAMGSMHTCALSTTNKVKCCGGNSLGTLGYGDKNNRGGAANEMGDNLPEVDLGEPSFIPTHIVAGVLHTCALSTTNNTIKCFGDNIHGQCGYGDGNYRGDEANEMGANLVYVDLGNNWLPMQITAGGSQTCALSTTNKVKCWGMIDGNSMIGNQPNEMGDYLLEINLGSFEPMHIVAGYYHKCALSSSSQVKCWGLNNYGQLGYGDTQTRSEKTAGEMGDNLLAVNLGSNFTPMQIVAGYDHNCALSTAKKVKCWGNNAAGQLGHGDTNNRGDAPYEMGDNLTTTDLGAFIPIKIMAGGSHNCALSAENKVKCWGNNNGGTLGYGDTNNRGDEANEMGDNLVDVDLLSTLNPSSDPTRIPTSNPTRIPTQAPTRIPTSHPTRMPTTAPTAPTRIPTRIPTTVPTRTPTLNPTGMPTTGPTRTPTSNPTGTPTSSPTRIPTAVPTRTPTLNPTRIPTKAPTRIPTAVPTRSPTSNPTRIPTTVPTLFPTDDHTSAQPNTAPTSWKECIDETIQLDEGYIHLFIKIDAASRAMQIQLSAPKDNWFGLGFGSDTMSNTLAITVSSIGGTMAVRPRRLRHHLQGDIVSNALDNVQTTVFASNRMVNILQSWTMDGLFDFSDFLDGNQCELPIIWAVGSDNMELGSHGSNRGSVTLRSCMCTKEPTDMPTKAPAVDTANGANYVEWWFGIGTRLLVVYCALFCF